MRGKQTLSAAQRESNQRGACVKNAGVRIDWSALTRSGRKAKLYKQETYFREGLGAAAETFNQRLPDFLHRAALLVIKPEGLVSDKVGAIVEFVRRNGFTIMRVFDVEITRLGWREMWRYQLSAASVDRLAVNDLIMCNRALVVLLRHEGVLAIPATVHLSVLKGPSDKSRQPVHCLRRLLDQPNRLFSLLHSADEPADLVREIAILLDDRTRRAAMSGLLDDQLCDLHETLLNEKIAASISDGRQFKTALAIDRLVQALEGFENCASQIIRRDVVKIRAGEKIAWQPFARAIEDAGVTIDRWDLALIGATSIEYDAQGMSKIITSVGTRPWLRGGGRSLLRSDLPEMPDV
jgi:hypothetical protein